MPRELQRGCPSASSHGPCDDPLQFSQPGFVEYRLVAKHDSRHRIQQQTKQMKILALVEMTLNNLKCMKYFEHCLVPRNSPKIVSYDNYNYQLV